MSAVYQYSEHMQELLFRERFEGMHIVHSKYCPSAEEKLLSFGSAILHTQKDEHRSSKVGKYVLLKQIYRLLEKRLAKRT